MIQANRDNWIREVLVIGLPMYIRELETMYLNILEAATNDISFNKHNANGIFAFGTGSNNPMHNIEIKAKVIAAHTGDKHWTHKLGDKVHPQKGQKRLSISGELHPNKKPENAAKISKSHLGKRIYIKLARKM